VNLWPEIQQMTNICSVITIKNKNNEEIGQASGKQIVLAEP